MQPISYMQTDPRWKNISYSAKGESTTIGKAGCGPTSCAMVVATLADPSVTPVEACAWSVEHGYKALHQGTYYSFVKAYLKEFGIECKQLNSSSIYGNKNAPANREALEAIKEGDWVICCMGKGLWTSSGHYILWYGLRDGKALIRDPNSRETNRTEGNLFLLQSQVKYLWHIKVQDYLKRYDEVVEKRPVKIFGKELTADGILKDGNNYLSPKVLGDAGLVVTNERDKAVISMNDVPVSIKGKEQAMDGFKCNGVTYVALRPMLEALDHKVGYENGIVTVD